MNLRAACGSWPEDKRGRRAGDVTKRSTDGVSPQTLASLVNGANVFVLFDTSDYMYRGFVFAQDAIAEFVRSLENADKMAFYSYSRDFSRSCDAYVGPPHFTRGAFDRGRR